MEGLWTALPAAVGDFWLVRALWQDGAGLKLQLTDGGSLWQEQLASPALLQRCNQLHGDLDLSLTSLLKMLREYVLPQPASVEPGSGRVGSSAARPVQYWLTGFAAEAAQAAQRAVAAGPPASAAGSSHARSASDQGAVDENQLHAAEYVVLRSEAPTPGGIRFRWAFVCQRQSPQLLRQLLVLPLLGAAAALAQALRSTQADPADDSVVLACAARKPREERPRV